MPQHVVYT